jgi:hypothetical protein
MRTRLDAVARCVRIMLLSAGLLSFAGLPAHAAAADPSFGSDVQYSTGTFTFPQGIAAGDLNNDDKVDLVTADAANKISPLPGNGDGTFGSLTPLAPGALSNPDGIVVTDLGDDANADLVVPNFGTDTGTGAATYISVLYGHGDFGFTRVNLNVGGTNPESVVAGDLTSDGVADVAVAVSGSDKAAIVKNDGMGNLALQPAATTGDDPVSIATGDFNKDGKLDLATSNFQASTVSVMLGNGDGTFAAKNDFPTGSGPAGIGVADFNGDGRPDIAASDFGTDKVSILLQNSNGTFGPKTDYPTGSEPAGLAVGDLNSDLTPDLAIANSDADTMPDVPTDTVSVLIGKGDGTFEPKTDLLVGNLPLAAPLIRDLNSDQRPDLSVANYNSDSVSVRLNTSQPGAVLSPASRSFGLQNLNTTSAVKSFAVINNGAARLHVDHLDIVGPQAADFHIAQDHCTGATVFAGHACAIGVTFKPLAKGTRTASVMVSDDAPSSPQSAGLTGTGTLPCQGLPATIVGTSGNDVLTGTPGRDVATLLGGQDTFRGAAGYDTVCGGPGNDKLLGQDGNDKLYGDSGDDFLSGGLNTDTCAGGPGADTTDRSCETKTGIP